MPKLLNKLQTQSNEKTELSTTTVEKRFLEQCEQLESTVGAEAEGSVIVLKSAVNATLNSSPDKFQMQEENLREYAGIVCPPNIQITDHLAVDKAA